MNQTYILKKYVEASCVSEAIALDESVEVAECVLMEDPEPSKSLPDAIGFQYVTPDEEDIECSTRNRRSRCQQLRRK
jgi:hypothetical protein